MENSGWTRPSQPRKNEVLKQSDIVKTTKIMTNPNESLEKEIRSKEYLKNEISSNESVKNMSRGKTNKEGGAKENKKWKCFLCCYGGQQGK